MGALRVDVALSNDSGDSIKPISTMYIWRTEAVAEDGWAEYYVTRQPPDYVEIITDSTMDGSVYNQIIVDKHAKFKHRYDDGAEICTARAILALEEAGLNV